MAQYLRVIDKDVSSANAVADFLNLHKHHSRRPDAAGDHAILENADKLRELIRIAEALLSDLYSAEPSVEPREVTGGICTTGASRDSLSPREAEILTWVARGKSNSVIGDILGISAHTVDTHLRRVFTKLDTSNRTVAAVKAVQTGLIPVPFEA